MANFPLPVRITPHALLATLVEVQYTPRTHSELALGAFHQALAEVGLVYERQLMGLLEQQTQDSSEPLFQGLGISLRIRPDRLLFNCVPVADVPPAGDEYLGWVRYFEIIQQVLTHLHGTNQIAAFPGISVRYINALPGVQLNEQLQVKLPSLGDLPAPQTTFYRATFANVQGFQIALSLADNQRVPGQREVRSVFDISVSTPTAGADLPALFDKLDAAHTCEKEVFFGLLDPAYLATLRPEYE